MKKYKCVCGHIIEYFIIDGYSVGDKVLEDVKFKVYIENDDTAHIAWEKNPDIDYLKTLNKEHWVKLLKEYVEECPQWLECPECKICLMEDDIAETLCEDVTVENIIDYGVFKEII